MSTVATQAARQTIQHLAAMTRAGPCAFFGANRIDSVRCQVVGRHDSTTGVGAEHAEPSPSIQASKASCILPHCGAKVRACVPVPVQYSTASCISML